VLAFGVGGVGCFGGSSGDLVNIGVLDFVIVDCCGEQILSRTGQYPVESLPLIVFLIIKFYGAKVNGWM
jgi:hypothetical protein